MVNCARGHVTPDGGLEVRLTTWAQYLGATGVDVSFCSLTDGSDTPAGAPVGVYQIPGESFTRHVFRDLEDLAYHLDGVDAVSVHQWPDWVTHPEKTVFMIHADMASCYPYAFTERLSDLQRPGFASRRPPDGHDPAEFTAAAILERMRCVKTLASCSEFASRSVTELTGRPCVTLYSAAHEEFFSQQNDDPRPVVAFVGRLTRDKGAETLIQALEAGAFDVYPLEVSEFSAHAEIAERFTTLMKRGAPVRLRPGTRSRAELAQYMAGVRCVLVPSLYEGFGTVAVEALAAGTPAVVSNVGGLPEAVAPVSQPTRWLVAPGDAAELARAVAEAAQVRVPEAERQALAGIFSIGASSAAYLEAMLRRA
jgi:glycosyltransferase involved in cell wall biosynthesis